MKKHKKKKIAWFWFGTLFYHGTTEDNKSQPMQWFQLSA
jgi:hypothetical protein